MTNINLQLLFFFVQLVLVFFVSRASIKEMFKTFRRFIKNDRTVSAIVSTIFFPGTIVHEVSHLLFALALGLRVQEIKIFPTIEESEIKLGRVLYERRDPIRGIMVGVAPLLVGLFAFFFFAYFKLFPGSSVLLNILIGYLVFTISTTMFSSKQDLVDLLYLIPFLIVIVGTIYIFNIKVSVVIQNQQALVKIAEAFINVNSFLFFALVLNILCIFGLKVLQSLGKK